MSPGLTSAREEGPPDALPAAGTGYALTPAVHGGACLEFIDSGLREMLADEIVLMTTGVRPPGMRSVYSGPPFSNTGVLDDESKTNLHVDCHVGDARRRPVPERSGSAGPLLSIALQPGLRRQLVRRWLRRITLWSPVTLRPLWRRLRFQLWRLRLRRLRDRRLCWRQLCHWRVRRPRHDQS